MVIVIGNGSEAEVATKPTEVIEFVGKDGLNGSNPDLLDFVRRDELGDLAWSDRVKLAMLDDTIIIGGYIKTTLIDVQAIKITGNLASVGEALAQANIAVALALTDFRGELGDLAFDDLIEASKLGSTIIDGGYIKSTLIDVQAIRVSGGFAMSSEVATAVSLAADAVNKATSAEQAARRAEVLLENIASDNILSAVEKPAILKEVQNIISEKPVIDAQALPYALSTVAYTTAYNNLITYVNPLIANLTTDTVIDGPVFRSTFKSYYDAKVALLKAISDKALVLVEEAKAEALAAAQLATGAVNAVDALSGSLGSLAFDNAVTLAKLDSTIIQGGYIKSTLIDVQVLIVDGDLETKPGATSKVTAAINTLTGTLGDLAYDDLVQLSKLGETIIIGGFIKTDLIDVEVLKADYINAIYIASLDVVSKSIRTNTTGQRIEILEASNDLKFYNANGTVGLNIKGNIGDAATAGIEMNNPNSIEDYYMDINYQALQYINGANSCYMSAELLIINGVNALDSFFLGYGSTVKIQTTPDTTGGGGIIIPGTIVDAIDYVLNVPKTGGGSYTVTIYKGHITNVTTA